MVFCAAVRLEVSDDDVDSLEFELLGFVHHLPGLADAGGGNRERCGAYRAGRPSGRSRVCVGEYAGRPSIGLLDQSIDRRASPELPGALLGVADEELRDPLFAGEADDLGCGS